MLYQNRSYNQALSPSREKRYVPDDTDVISNIGQPSDVVILAEAKHFLPVHDNESDTNIQKFLDGVIGAIERFLQQDLFQKKRQSYWRRVPDKAILPMGPHKAFDEVKVVDPSTGQETILEEDVNYRLSGLKYKTLEWISVESGELYVTYDSGYDPGNIPPEAPGAILQELSLQYKNRSDPDVGPTHSVNNLSVEARHLLLPIARLAY